MRIVDEDLVGYYLMKLWHKIIIQFEFAYKIVSHARRTKNMSPTVFNNKNGEEQCKTMYAWVQLTFSQGNKENHEEFRALNQCLIYPLLKSHDFPRLLACLFNLNLVILLSI
jgi:hypothetical protein